MKFQKNFEGDHFCNYLPRRLPRSETKFSLASFHRLHKISIRDTSEENGGEGNKKAKATGTGGKNNITNCRWEERNIPCSCMSDMKGCSTRMLFSGCATATTGKMTGNDSFVRKMLSKSERVHRERLKLKKLLYRCSEVFFFFA